LPSIPKEVKIMNSHAASALNVRRIIPRSGLCLGLAVLLTGLVIASFGTVRAQEQSLLAAPAFDRSEDPVVITGTRFPAFSGAPLSELVAYAYRGGEWAPVPFQIDEVNISGTFVTNDDGFLGSRDELVFMAGDAGDSVSTAEWPVDTQARLASRYAITVSDPLSASQQAWVYLYRSTTLTRSNVSYITWTFSAQTATAISYTAAFSPAKFVGLSDLFINGGNVDILDRQKTRVNAGIFNLNEEGLVTLLGSATISLPIAGPVRAATNDGDLKAAFYGSRIDFDVTFNLGGLPLTVSSIRTSFDWISPTLSGLHTYFDSNTPGGVPIDGVPDVISTTPRTDWFQVNGDIAGPGGMVMAIPSLNHGGTVSNYYADNQANVGGDTGDLHSFADAGPFINNPGAVVNLMLMTYILPPGTDTNVGAAYYARAGNPLQTNTLAQCYAPTGQCLRVYLPLMLKNLTGAQ
jgi:hypothetical protein